MGVTSDLRALKAVAQAAWMLTHGHPDVEFPVHLRALVAQVRHAVAAVGDEAVWKEEEEHG